MNNTILCILLGIALQLLSACGSGDPQTDSETQSLTGPIGPGPCGFYGLNHTTPNFYCAMFNDGNAVNVLFDLQGFTPTQLTLVRASLDVMVAGYNQYWQESIANPTGTAGLTRCLMDNAKNDLTPVNSKFASGLKSLDQKLKWAPNTLAFGFAFHQKTRTIALIQGIDIAQTKIQKEKEFFTFAQAFVGNDDLVGDNMNLDINRKALDLPGFRPEHFAGTIIHELLHRRGYEHPGADANKPEGYANTRSLVTVFGECITTKNTLTPGISLTAKKGPKIGGG